MTSENRNAVLMSEEEYDSLMETLHLPSDPDMAADLYRTRRTPLSESGIARIHSDPGSAGTQRLRGAEEKGLRPEGGYGARTAPLSIGSAGGERMRTLYIIGNGFDLANGVRSSYRDFREHLLSLGPEGVRMAVTLESYLGSSPDLWGDFEESLGFLDRGMAMDSVDDAFDDHGDVRGCVERGLAGVTSIEEELPRLFRSWLRTLRAEGPVWEPPVPLDPDGAYIDFNYTDLLESRYGIPRGNILYIHGSVAEGDGSIVMGHGSDPDRSYGEWVSSLRDDPSYRPYVRNADGEVSRNTRLSAQAYGEYPVRDGEWGCDSRRRAMEIALVGIEEYFEITAKRCREVIERNRGFFDSLRDVGRVVVIGHSLSQVDMPYFREIIRCSGDPDDIEWVVCYRSRRARAEGFVEDLGLDPSRVRYVCTLPGNRVCPVETDLRTCRRGSCQKRFAGSSDLFLQMRFEVQRPSAHAIRGGPWDVVDYE